MMRDEWDKGNGHSSETVNIGGSDRTELQKIAEQLAQLRQQVAEGAKREEFDELVVKIRAEIKTDKPDPGRLSKMFWGASQERFERRMRVPVLFS
jgi:hypothetical protein